LKLKISEISLKILRLSLLSMVLLLISIRMEAQNKPATHSKKAIDAYNKALQSYSLHNYSQAEAFLLEAIKSDSEFIDAYLLLAEVDEDWEQPLKAIDAYRRGLKIDEKYYPAGFIKLAHLEYGEGLYAEALASYNHFIDLHTGNTGNEERARAGILRCSFSIHAMEHPVDFKPVNLGPNINTISDEYWPCLSTDENTLVITRLVRTDDFLKKVQEDFFISQWGDSGWRTMKNAGNPLNTPDNEGAQTISGDGRTMIFTACNRKDGMGRCDLYWSVKEGDQWSQPKNLGKPINTAYRETQPSITPDGRTLYFSSDRPGGKGQHDLWVSYRQSDELWSLPENMGDSVNTTGTEMSPFIHPDNQSLYFSSNGHIGMGGFDLFVSRRDSAGIWKKPVNLGYPINTNRDEIGLIVNSRGDKAYFSSDINTSTGKDIYVFDMPVQNRPEMVTYMKGRVMDAVTGQLLGARFELIDLENGKALYKSNSDSISGEFVVSIPVHHNYMLNVSRKGYLFYSDNFTLKGNFQAGKPFLKDVPLQPLVIGKSVVLSNVFYETDSYALKKESEIELNKVVQMLQANPGIRIEISGHTDNTGLDDHNLKLSENRAKTVADYLISASIKPDRIVYKGYGMRFPIASNDSEEGKAKNRRTEMKIIR
jgi:outer membrane protein OmpA-like peptidoglycan-associated protein